MPDNTFRQQVNGSLLPQFQGKNVSLIGEVLKSDGSGLSFDIKTSDNVVVTVTMPQPISEPLSGLVEVMGVGKGRNSIICDNYLQFGDDLARTYDAEIDNAAVTFLNSTDNVWK